SNGNLDQDDEKVSSALHTAFHEAQEVSPINAYGDSASRFTNDDGIFLLGTDKNPSKVTELVSPPLRVDSSLVYSAKPKSKRRNHMEIDRREMLPAGAVSSEEETPSIQRRRSDDTDEV